MNKLTLDYENRFRDPVFLEVWDRWHKALGIWRSATGGAYRNCPVSMDPCNPDPSQLTGSTKVAAEEYLAARAAYRQLLSHYLSTEPHASAVP
jgi:hypothetical protein